MITEKRSLEALIYSRSPINRYKDVYENFNSLLNPMATLKLASPSM